MEQNNTNLVRGYSKAIFSIANQYKTEEQFLLLLNFLDIVIKDLRIKKIIINSQINFEDKANFLLDLIDNKLGTILATSIKTIVNSLIKLLAKSKLLLLIPRIYLEYDKLYLQFTHKLRVEITSAIDLDSTQKQDLQKNLIKYFNQEILVDYKTDTTIIAGIIIRYADEIIDFSFKSRLLNLGNLLKA